MRSLRATQTTVRVMWQRAASLPGIAEGVGDKLDSILAQHTMERRTHAGWYTCLDRYHIWCLKEPP